jgi:hypothetical protein
MAKPRPHIPTAKTLSQVRIGAMLGIPPHDIAKLLGITKGQLLKHYAKGHATGPDRADKAVRANLLIQVKNKGSGAVDNPKTWLHRQQANTRPQRSESHITQTEFAHAKSAIPRLAKVRGELINRSAQLDACETAGRMIERAIMAIPMWTEEAVGIYRTGGDSAFRQWLRAKAVETCESLADLMQHPATLDDPCIGNRKKSGTRSEGT